ncbi:MAG: HEAT repeat domain-containing protein [Acidobacteria bacterium]|jgi:HEAT repeat protein|nr:HEAT repeat domain-containing protein [Acidobacteriota bacterium]MBA4185203.1 HEAT repeat domain-containing protein [Acidobacteriota bacterium]
MKRVKSTQYDEIILRDESTSPADRVSAATVLASDGFGQEIFPVLEKWLNHSHFLLRAEAIWMILSGFGHQKYVEKAIQMLHNDDNWSVRKYASLALSDFSKEYVEGKKYEEQIIKELLISLLNDEDGFVQRDSYKGLYKLIKGKRERSDENEFDRNRDVDWDLLLPYLDKYGLQKPV